MNTQDIATIIAEYKNGTSTTHLAKRFNVSVPTVWHHLRKHNVTPRRTGRPKGSGFIDISIGTTFGKWTVIGPGQQPDTSKSYYFPCRCECGLEKPIRGSQLRAGKTEGCPSCMAFDRFSRECDADLTGQRFGKWNVIRRTSVEERPAPDKTWLCVCDCGTEAMLASSHIRRGLTGCFRCGEYFRLRPYESTYNAGRHAASIRQLEFTITYEMFAEIAITGRCHYCHIPVDWPMYGSTALHLDRKDNTQGYLPGNVVGCCKRCNYAKSDQYTYEEWFAMTECFRAANSPSHQ